MVTPRLEGEPDLDFAERLLGLASASPPHPTARSEILFVTPQMAAAWLERNTNNRKRAKSVRERLVASMREDLWKLDISAIAFYVDGTLANGQHRLDGVVETQIGQWFLVMWGVPHESRAIIDGGKRRTLYDFLVMDGLVNDAQAASVLRYIMYIERVWAGRMASFNDAHGQPTIGELLAFAHTLIDPEAGRNDLSPSLTMGRYMQLCDAAPLSVAIAGACHFHISQVFGRETADRFFGLVAKGLGMTSEKDPIYRLRKNLLANAMNIRRLPAMVLAAMVLKAFNYWSAGDSITTLRWAADSEPFPVLGGKPHDSLRRRRKADAAQPTSVGAAPVASLVGGDDR